MEQTPGNSEGQGNMCSSPWHRRVRQNLVSEQEQQHTPLTKQKNKLKMA